MASPLIQYHLYIHSFDKYLSSSHYVLKNTLGARDSLDGDRQTPETPRVYILVREGESKHIKYIMTDGKNGYEKISAARERKKDAWCWKRWPGKAL